MLNQIAYIGNKYAGVIALAVEQPIGRVEGEYEKAQFEEACSPILKLQYLDLLVVDTTAIKGNIAEELRWLKMVLAPNTRIIVLAPNLDDKAVIQQLLVYGIYDIVRPEINEETMDDLAIKNTLLAELRWALQEPVSFAKVANDLSILVNETIETEKTVISPVEAVDSEKTKKEKKEKKVVNKPRLLAFYDFNDQMVKYLADSGRYTIIDTLREQENLDIDLSKVDIVVMDKCSISFIGYIKSLAEVQASKIKLIACSDLGSVVESYKELGVSCFSYKDGKDFLRGISVESVRTETKPLNISTIYGVYGVKGGVGSTALTAIMAKEYAKKHPDQKVLVLDYSTKTGDLGIKFGIDTPNPNIFELVASFLKAKADHLELELLKNKVLNYTHSVKGVDIVPTGFGDIYKYTNYIYTADEISFIYCFLLEKFKAYYNAIFVDINKYGGFTYEEALSRVDKLVLVSDCKLASVAQLQIKLDELKQKQLLNKTAVVFNKSAAKTNSNQLDNARVIEGIFDKKKIYHLPFDKKLDAESDEMNIQYKNNYKKAVNKLLANEMGG